LEDISPPPVVPTPVSVSFFNSSVVGLTPFALSTSVYSKDPLPIRSLTNNSFANRGRYLTDYPSDLVSHKPRNAPLPPFLPFLFLTSNVTINLQVLRTCPAFADSFPNSSPPTFALFG